MAGLGFPEIMVILIVALVVFGPRKLPELGKSLGAGLREFRRSTQGLKEEFEGVMKDADGTHQAAAQSIQAQPVQPIPVSAPVTVISAQPQGVQSQVVQPQVVQPQQVILAQDAAVAPASVVNKAEG